MRLILPISFLGCIAVFSCNFIAVEEPSSSSTTQTPRSSSSSLDCSVFSSSSTNEDLCSDFDPDIEIEHYGKMKKQFCDERDGKKYAYVQIGEQIWMAENLNYDICGSKCAIGIDYIITNNEFGRLYDWFTALTICPEGWHLPSEAEWTVLAYYAGGRLIAGSKLKAFVEDWTCNQENTGLRRDYLIADSYSCKGVKENTDDYGFSALPGGYHDGYSFMSVYSHGGVWWSNTEFQIHAYYNYLSSYINGLSSYYISKKNFLSVRCVKDIF